MQKDRYACIECGYVTPKWIGRCLNCGSWNSLKKVENSGLENKSSVKSSTLINVSKIDVKNESRLKTLSKEFDRVLGGGIVSGEVILIGGEPGIGKTTFLMQFLNRINSSKQKCIYVSAEESLEQLAVHIDRLGINSDISMISDNDIDSILSALSKGKSSVVVIDSIQTVKTLDLAGLPGGIGQVKECTSRIANFAKKRGITFILVGHITKGGDLAGPKVIEHLVDAVLYLEGDSADDIRVIRSVKNRFGSTKEIGVFRYGKRGFSDIKSPSKIFVLSKQPRVGICKSIIFEGQRPILIEVQALVTKCAFSFPQRIVNGIKKSKIQMLCALLSKYTKADFFKRDIYINIPRMSKLEDASLDLCICIALISSYFNKTVSSERIAIGEASLTGQIHKSSRMDEKLKALDRLGYKEVVLSSKFGKDKIRSGKYIFLDSIEDIVNAL